MFEKWWNEYVKRNGHAIGDLRLARMIALDAWNASDGKFPEQPSVKYEGKLYFRTGKLAHHVQTGVRCSEYENEDHQRLWLDVNGNISKE